MLEFLLSFHLDETKAGEKKGGRLTYVQNLQEILHFTAFRMYTRDDSLQVWHALYELREIFPEGRMVDKILDSVQSR